MKRVTQYLYECQREKRVRNIGFVKAEFAKDSGSIQIQARGMDTSCGKQLSVYLFYPKEDGYESIFQRQISQRIPLLNYVLEFSKEDMGDARTTEELSGIFLVDEERNCYMATWNDEAVDVGRIQPREEVERAEEEAEQVRVISEKEAEEQGKVVSAEAMEEELEVPPMYVCEKIQRKDLARLPRKEWYLANNNFLLHGWYNYHHLLWLEEGENLFIGVPGVCHPRECQVARAFGFPEFRAACEIGAGIGREESGREEDFGYFCRRIRRNR